MNNNKIRRLDFCKAFAVVLTMLLSIGLCLFGAYLLAKSKDMLQEFTPSQSAFALNQDETSIEAQAFGVDMFTVSYFVDGILVNQVTVAEYDFVDIDPPHDLSSTQVFLGWYIGDQQYYGGPLTQDTVLEARIENKSNRYEVSENTGRFAVRGITDGGNDYDVDTTATFKEALDAIDQDSVEDTIHISADELNINEAVTIENYNCAFVFEGIKFFGVLSDEFYGEATFLISGQSIQFIECIFDFKAELPKTAIFKLSSSQVLFDNCNILAIEQLLNAIHADNSTVSIVSNDSTVQTIFAQQVAIYAINNSKIILDDVRISSGMTAITLKSGSELDFTNSIIPANMYNEPAISCDSATVNIYSGSITSNSMETIFSQNGNINIYGGEVLGNLPIRMFDGKFQMFGGKLISNGTAFSSMSAELVLQGGRIEGSGTSIALGSGTIDLYSNTYITGTIRINPNMLTVHEHEGGFICNYNIAFSRPKVGDIAVKNGADYIDKFYYVNSIVEEYALASLPNSSDLYLGGYVRVVFDPNGGSFYGDGVSETLHFGESVACPSKVPYLDDKIFGGWYTLDGENYAAWDFANDLVLKDTVLYALWAERTYSYTISKDTSSGEYIAVGATDMAGVTYSIQVADNRTNIQNFIDAINIDAGANNCEIHFDDIAIGANGLVLSAGKQYTLYGTLLSEGNVAITILSNAKVISYANITCTAGAVIKQENSATQDLHILGGILISESQDSDFYAIDGKNNIYLDNATISNPNATGGITTSAGDISIVDSHITTNTGLAVYIRQGQLEIENSDLQADATVVVVSNSQSVVISDSTTITCTSSVDEAALSIYNSMVLITDSHLVATNGGYALYDFKSNEYDGDDTKYIAIKDSTLTAKAISVSLFDSIAFVENTAISSELGEGIKALSSWLELKNCQVSSDTKNAYFGFVSPLARTNLLAYDTEFVTNTSSDSLATIYLSGYSDGNSSTYTSGIYLDNCDIKASNAMGIRGTNIDLSINNQTKIETGFEGIYLESAKFSLSNSSVESHTSNALSFVGIADLSFISQSTIKSDDAAALYSFGYMGSFTIDGENTIITSNVTDSYFATVSIESVAGVQNSTIRFVDGTIQNNGGGNALKILHDANVYIYGGLITTANGNGYAIVKGGTGRLTISKGVTVTNTAGTAIHLNSASTIDVSGNISGNDVAILANVVSGQVQLYETIGEQVYLPQIQGKLKVIPNALVAHYGSVPTQVYNVELINFTYTPNNVVVVENGYSALEKFAIVNTGYTLITFGADIVLKYVHTVTFDSKGGNAVASQVVDHNTTATQPQDPSREHYLFLGWYTDEDELWNFADFVTEDMTLTAKWMRKAYSYTISKDTSTGEYSVEAATGTDGEYYYIEVTDDRTNIQYFIDAINIDAGANNCEIYFDDIAIGANGLVLSAGKQYTLYGTLLSEGNVAITILSNAKVISYANITCTAGAVIKQENSATQDLHILGGTLSSQAQGSGFYAINGKNNICLDNATINNPNAAGGIITSAGDISIVDSHITTNTALAVSQTGNALNISNSEITSSTNVVDVRNSNSVTISGSTITGNVTGAPEYTLITQNSRVILTDTDLIATGDGIAYFVVDSNQKEVADERYVTITGGSIIAKKQALRLLDSIVYITGANISATSNEGIYATASWLELRDCEVSSDTNYAYNGISYSNTYAELNAYNTKFVTKSDKSFASAINISGSLPADNTNFTANMKLDKCVVEASSTLGITANRTGVSLVNETKITTYRDAITLTSVKLYIKDANIASTNGIALNVISPVDTCQILNNSIKSNSFSAISLSGDTSRLTGFTFSGNTIESKATLADRATVSIDTNVAVQNSTIRFVDGTIQNNGGGNALKILHDANVYIYGGLITTANGNGYAIVKGGTGRLTISKGVTVTNTAGTAIHLNSASTIDVSGNISGNDVAILANAESGQVQLYETIGEQVYLPQIQGKLKVISNALVAHYGSVPTQVYNVELIDFTYTPNNVVVVENGYSALEKFAIVNTGYTLITFGADIVLKYVHTVTFDSKGGNDVASQVVDHNTTATQPQDPSKAGYDFLGWYTAQNVLWDFADLVTEDMTLTAKWAEISYEYTIEMDSGSIKASNENIVLASSSQAINVINAIKQHANGQDCAIHFGRDGNALVISIAEQGIVLNGGAEGNDWGEITLFGKLSASPNSSILGTLRLINVNVISYADITTQSFHAVYAQNSTLRIFGGTIQTSQMHSAIYLQDSQCFVDQRAGHEVKILSTHATGKAIEIEGGQTDKVALTIIAGTIEANATAVSNLDEYIICNADILMQGGTVASATGYAFNVRNTLTITGGEVQSDNIAINMPSGTLNIANANILAQSVAINSATADITVEGSSDISSQTNSAIYSIDSFILIKHGQISSSSIRNNDATIFNKQGLTKLEGGTSQYPSIISAHMGIACATETGKIEVLGGKVQSNLGIAISVFGVGTLEMSGASTVVQSLNGTGIKVDGLGGVATVFVEHTTIIAGGASGYAVFLTDALASFSDTVIGAVNNASAMSFVDSNVVLNDCNVSAEKNAISCYNTQLGLTGKTYVLAGILALRIEGNTVLVTLQDNVTVTSNGSVTVLIDCADTGTVLDMKNGKIVNAGTGSAIMLHSNSQIELDAGLVKAVAPSNATISAVNGKIAISENMQVVATTGKAINQAAGQLYIEGTVQAEPSQVCIDFSGTELILNKQASIIGEIHAPTNVIEADNLLDTTCVFYINLTDAPNPSDIAVVNGAQFSSNFILQNQGLALAASMDDLVVVIAHTVTFDTANGNPAFTQNVAHNSTIVVPQNPSWAGHAFVGWMHNGSLFSLDTPIVGDLTLVASWAVPSYEYFVTVGGKGFVVNSYTFDGQPYVVADTHSLQMAIDAIKIETHGQDCAIHFGETANPIDIGDQSIVFDGGAEGNDWGELTLFGALIGAPQDTVAGAVLTFTNVSLISYMDVTASNAKAILAQYSQLQIFGGTISAQEDALLLEGTICEIDERQGFTTLIVSVDEGVDITANNSTPSSLTMLNGRIEAKVAIGSLGSTPLLNLRGGHIEAIYTVINGGGLIHIEGTTVSSQKEYFLLTGVDTTFYGKDLNIYSESTNVKSNLIFFSGILQAMLEDCNITFTRNASIIAARNTDLVLKNTNLNAVGIAVNALNTNLSIEDCVIESNTKDAIYFYVRDSAIYGLVTATVNNSTITNNAGRAVYVSDARASIQDSIISSQNGYALEVIGSVVTAENTQISSQENHAIYGLLADILLEDCTVSSINQSAVYLYDNSSNSVVIEPSFVAVDSQIYSEQSDAIKITHDTQLSILGGQVYSLQGSAIVNEANTQVLIEDATVYSGESMAIYNNAQGLLSITNSQVYSNTDTAIFNHADGQIELYDVVLSSPTEAIDMNDAQGQLSIQNSASIEGQVRIFAGQLSLYNLDTTSISIFVLDAANGIIAAYDASAYIDQLDLANSDFALRVDGDDIILRSAFVVSFDATSLGLSIDSQKVVIGEYVLEPISIDGVQIVWKYAGNEWIFDEHTPTQDMQLVADATLEEIGIIYYGLDVNKTYDGQAGELWLQIEEFAEISYTYEWYYFEDTWTLLAHATDTLDVANVHESGQYKLKVIAQFNLLTTYVEHEFEVQILPKAITVAPVAGQSKKIGEDDSTLLYSIVSGTLVPNDSFIGYLTREAGEEIGEYSILQGTLALSGNYDLTFVSGVKFAIRALEASFTFSSGAGYEVQCDQTSPVADGTDVSFKVLLDEAYSNSKVVVTAHFADGGSATLQASNGSYTLHGLAQDVHIEVTGVRINTYRVTFAAGTNGSVVATVDNTSVNSRDYVAHGSTIMLMATPDMGYAVHKWTVNLSPTYTNRAWQTYTVTSGMTIFVDFVALPTLPEGETYTLSGTVQDFAGTDVPYAMVVAVQGVSFMGSAVTNGEGSFTINYLPTGRYNISAVFDGKHVTVLAEIKDSDAHIDIVIPELNISSRVDIKNGAPNATVSGLHELTLQEGFLTTEQQQVLLDGGSSELVISIGTTQSTVAPEQGKEVGLVLDINVDNILTDKDGASTSNRFSTLSDLIAINIPLSTSLQNKENYVIYRIHNGQRQTISLTPNAAGEYFELNSDGKSLTIYTKNFSNYAIAFDAEVQEPTDPDPTDPTEPTDPTDPKDPDDKDKRELNLWWLWLLCGLVIASIPIALGFSYYNYYIQYKKRPARASHKDSEQDDDDSEE